MQEKQKKTYIIHATAKNEDIRVEADSVLDAMFYIASPLGAKVELYGPPEDKKAWVWRVVGGGETYTLAYEEK